MHRINNYKFTSLVNQLKNKHNSKLFTKLESLQPNAQLCIIFDKNRNTKMDLMKLYNSIEKFKKENTISKNKQIPEPKSQKHVHTSSNFSNDKVSIKSLNSLLNISPDYLLLSQKKDSRNDNYSDIFFKNIDPIFRSSRDRRFNNDYLKKQKIKIIDIFNKQGFYKKFAYSSKDFKKSELEDAFTMNTNINLNMIKVYSNIFRINFVYKNVDDNDFTYMTRFDKNNAAFILIEDHNNLYTLYNKNNTYIRGIELSSILSFEKNYDKKTLEKMKLDELQNLAKMKNKEIKKQGKVTKINKTKEELISEIAM